MGCGALHRRMEQAVVSAVAGVVGMIPEGLVLLTSLNFAVARHAACSATTRWCRNLIRGRRSPAVDALNLDKTGTITDGGIAFNQLIMLGSRWRELSAQPTEGGSFETLTEQAATQASTTAATRNSPTAPDRPCSPV